MNAQERLKRCAAKCEQLAKGLEAMSLAPIDCGRLALEILGLEAELNELKQVFAAKCLGTGTP